MATPAPAQLQELTGYPRNGIAQTSFAVGSYQVFTTLKVLVGGTVAVLKSLYFT